MNYNFKKLERVIVKHLYDESFYSKKLNLKELKTAKWIMMAPPNMTGIVHLGHIWDLVIPDFYTRYWHLNGERVVFIPGKDHAGIATQVKVEEHLKKQKIKVSSLTKAQKIKHAQDWVSQFSIQAEDVWTQYAISCNKNYLTYTLEKKVIDITLDLVIEYFNKGYIYQDYKIVNFDLKLKTVISNEELERKKEKAKLYYVKYPIKNLKKYLVVATTRPETIFSDVCLFVHPKSKYANLDIIVLNPLTSKELKIYVDKSVDNNYGSGILKCTPHHDVNDFNLYQKHNLELGKQSINIEGKLTDLTGAFVNKTIEEGRIAVVDLLKKKNLIQKIETIENEKLISTRSGSYVEPLISNQWFLSVSKICKDAFSNFLNTSFLNPKHFENKLQRWGRELNDWCISRQLWWGIQMPIYKNKQGKFKAFKTNPDIKEWTQIEDVLDTWFTSGHWPIITSFIHAKKYKNYELVGMGTDIFFSWAVRMILTSFLKEKKIAFKHCLFHGLLRDSKGRKMSKSLGNGINPLQEAKEQSADAIRWVMLSRNNYGFDINYKVNIINEAHGLIKKISSIVSFFEHKLNNKKAGMREEIFNIFYDLIDKEIKNIINDCQELVRLHKLNLYCLNLRKFIMNKISSTYIEIIKWSNMNKKQLLELFKLLLIPLQLIEPIMPIFTKYLFTYIKDKFNISLIQNINQYLNLETQRNTSLTIDIFAKVFKALVKLKFNLEESIYVTTNDKKLKNLLVDFLPEKIMKKILFIDTEKKLKDYSVLPLVEGKIKTIIYYKLMNENKGELKKRIKNLEFEIKRSQTILNNEAFRKKAPSSLVAKEKEKLIQNQEKLEKIIVKFKVLKNKQ